MWKTSIALMCLAGAAQAADCTGASLRFVESAPRDRFELQIGTQPLRAVTVDLRGSAGRLIFDTEDGGTGVEVFQPLRDEGGTQASDVADGAEVIKVALRETAAGGRAAFSIDVDDRMTSSDLGQIRVTGGEMAGATAIFETADGTQIKAVFDDRNRAQVCS
ncbi:aggregation factor core [Sulfitobacter sp. HNIBRBA2951]|uniref:aggregation factor core n=1 Tax=Sulfitobacter aquimarinus TaxID=3158557 RepID=UPI0032DEB700